MPQRETASPSFNSSITGHPEEDFGYDGSAQATVVVGGQSEVTWLYRLKCELSQEYVEDDVNHLERPIISSVSYVPDEAGLVILQGTSLSKRPPKHIADQLVDSYFQNVHPLFPVVGKKAFQKEYGAFYSDSSVRHGDRWLSIFNLVLAIATRHSFLAGNFASLEHDGHELYFSRGWRLNKMDHAILDQPDLQEIQVEGLTAFYLFSVGQVHISWRIIGIAIGSAVTMNSVVSADNCHVLHDSHDSHDSHERYTALCALFVLNTTLSIITGRPSNAESLAQLIRDERTQSTSLLSVLSGSCTAWMSENNPDHGKSTRLRSGSKRTERQSNQVTPEILQPGISYHLVFLSYAVDLAFLTENAIGALYAPGQTGRSWLEVEPSISAFDNMAESWRSRIPFAFHLSEDHTAYPFAYKRDCTALALQFFSTKLIILQPSLHHVALSVPTPTCQDMAMSCLETAMQLVDLLPDTFDTTWLFEASPWCFIPHYITQSTVILLIGLSHRYRLDNVATLGIYQQIKKAMRLLDGMSMKDPTTRQAWLVFTDILSEHSPKLGVVVSQHTMY